jgi:hypothetical protein
LALLIVVAPAASLGPGRAAPQPPSLSIDDPTLTVGAEGPAAVEFTVTVSGVTEPPTTQPVTTTTQPAGLPSTGSAVVPIALVAAALIIAGLVALALRRLVAPPVVILLVGVAGGAAAAFAGSVAHAQPEQPVITVQFHTEDGTATAPEDYTATSGTIGFVPGQTTATIVVPVNPLLDGSGKTFTVVLTDPVGATISKAVGTATIIVEAPTTTSEPTATTTTAVTATTTTAVTTTSTGTTAPTTVSSTTSSTTTSTTLGNQAPSAVDDSYSIAEDTPLTVAAPGCWATMPIPTATACRRLWSVGRATGR